MYDRLRSLLLLALLLVIFIGLIAACSDDSGPRVKKQSDDVGLVDVPDVGDEEDTSEEPERQFCDDGREVCDGRCVDTSYEMNHCGGCNIRCQNGSQSCRDGQCVCLNADRDLLCDGRCVDVTSDSRHCGGCGKACGSGEVCVDSECAPISGVPEVQDVVYYTNLARQQGQDCGEHGWKDPAPDLQPDDDLHEAAQVHSEDMARGEFMAHEGSDGSDFVERIERTDYPGFPVGENVAMGYRSGEAVVDGWVDSDGHCKNLMNPNATKIGVGYATSRNGTPYWTQVFGR